MSDNTTKLTPQEVIAGLAKGLGVQEIPDTYTKQFGGDMLFGLGAEMQRHRGLVPMIVVEGFREKYAQRIFVEDVMKKMGLEDNAQNTQMVTSMISEAEDAVSTLNQSVDAGETISLKITESEPTTLPETRMETVNEPERTVSADDKVDIKLVQTLLSGAIGRTNQLRHDLLVGPSLGLNRPLANIGATSDAWNDTSLGAVNAVIDLLKESNGLSARFSESGYTPELGLALQQKMEGMKTELEGLSPFLDPIDHAALDKKIDTLNEILPENQRAQVFAALDRLSENNELRTVEIVARQVEVIVPVTTAADNTAVDNTAADNTAADNTAVDNTAADNTAADITDAVRIANENKGATSVVEGILALVGPQLDKMPGMGMISQFGLTDQLVKPLTAADLTDGDGVFGANSQDLAAKLIMGLKMIDDPKNENPNGHYDQDIGANLRLSILTKPEFEFIRDQIKSKDGTPLRLFGAGGNALSGVSEADQLKVARQLLTFDTTEPGPPAADATQEVKVEYEAQMKERTDFATLYAKDLEAVRDLNAFFTGLDTLERNGLYNNEKAKQTNQRNVMMDAASGLLDQWAPDVKIWLRDFFTNSQFGQMISGIMSQFFGINVGRLWGDTDDAAALGRSQPLIESSFSEYYDDAQVELMEAGKPANHSDIMKHASDTIMAEMNGSVKFKAAMEIVFKDQDKDVIKDAVRDALVAAQSGKNLTEARKAFSNSLLESGTRFRNGAKLSDEDENTINALLMETSNEIRAVAAGPDLTVPTLKDDGSQLGTSETISSVVSPNGQERVRDVNAPAVGAEVIAAGEQNVELIYKPDPTQYKPGPERFSHDRVNDIQAVLDQNSDKLGLTINLSPLKNSDGAYTDTMTATTNAAIEETLIRAQIHRLQSKNIVITQDHLNGFGDRDGLTMELLDTVTEYMIFQEVSAADIAKFNTALEGPVEVNGKKLEGLGVDYFSTNSNDPLDRSGDKQASTVWEQTHFGAQFELKLAQWIPDTAPIATDLTNEDPLRDRYLEYNKDRSCEIPLFFKKEGSNDVFALIRDKNGNDDPADDTFRELEFDKYLVTRRIQDGDAPDLKAVLDYYNWENPTDRGVRDVINCVLGIEPFSVEVNAPSSTVEEPRIPLNIPPPSTTNQSSSVSGEAHKRPEAFRGDWPLRRVTSEQAEFLTEQLGLQSNTRVMRQSDRDKMDPLEVFFEQQIRKERAQNSPFVMLELDAHGIDGNGKGHPDFDVVLAMRNESGNLEFRYIDYETDAIRPIPKQREGLTDIAEKFDANEHDNGLRRLDDFIDEISRTHGNRVQGASNGYAGMVAIVPNGAPGGNHLVGGFQAVYGEELMKTNFRDYVAATSARHSLRTAHEIAQGHEDDIRRRQEVKVNGISDAEKSRLDELARNGSVSQRSGEFNQTSGVVQNRGPMSLTRAAHENMPGPFKGSVGAFAAQIDMIKYFLGSGKSDDDGQQSNDIDQNANDIGADLTNAPAYQTEQPETEINHPNSGRR